MTVRSEELTWTSDEQHQFYVINLEGATPTFDVLMLDVIWVPEFAQAGWLLDLSPWVTREELAPHFPAAVAAATWGDRVWGVPWNMNVGVLYYRADLLAKYGLAPPRTWEALVEQAELIRARERDPKLDGVLWQGKQYEGLVCNVVEQFWASGTALFGDDGRVLPDLERAAGGAGVHARPDRPRREPGVGDRRRRGADAPGIRRRPRGLPALVAVRDGSLRAAGLSGARTRGHRGACPDTSAARPGWGRPAAFTSR